MKRDLYDDIIVWKDLADRRPLIIRGARQTGKTWLVREVGKTFENYIELNFELILELQNFFENSIEPIEIIKNLKNYLGKDIIPGKTLLFFDEIQQCPRALLSLRYFYELYPSLHIIAAGSLLEFAIDEVGIPVGRVQFLYLYPLSFGEFLTANSKQHLRNMVLSEDKTAFSLPMKRQFQDLLKYYFLIGGMPQVVVKFIETENVIECQKILSILVQSYKFDFSKYAKDHQVKYLDYLFDNIPSQICHKFVFSNVRQDVKSNVLNDALTLLEKAGIAYRVGHTKAEGVPLTYDSKRFKVILFDIGIAQTIAPFDYSSFISDPNFMQVNSGAIAESFVGQEIVAYSDSTVASKLFYWERVKRGSQAEVDYLLQKGFKIMPIEVKAGKTGHLKSLHLFLNQKEIEQGYQVYQGELIDGERVSSVPLFWLESLLR